MLQPSVFTLFLAAMLKLEIAETSGTECLCRSAGVLLYAFKRRMTSLEINATLIAQIINFLILVFILKKLAYKPLMEMMEARQASIADDLATAEKDRQDAADLKREYQTQLTAARAEAQAIVDKAMKQAEKNKEEIIEEARVEHARLLKAAQEEISRERELALAELRAEVVGLSMAAAAKIIEKNLDAETNSKLVSDFMDKLDEKKIGGLPC